KYPATFKGQDILPPEGKSLRPALNNERVEEQPLYWEHEGHAAIRIGKWKLVKAYPGDWELFDMDKDRTELIDLALEYPERVKDMATQYEAWRSEERRVGKEWRCRREGDSRQEDREGSSAR